MRQRCKRLLVLLLTIAMVTSSLSGIAFAEEDVDEQVITEAVVEESSEAAEVADEAEAAVEETLETEDVKEPLEISDEEVLNQEGETQITEETFTISQNGTYQLAEGLATHITVAAGVTNITIIGNGVDYNTDPTDEEYGKISSTANAMTIDMTQTAGIHLTLQDLYNSVRTNQYNVLDFAGANNILSIEGIVVNDYDYGYTSKNDAVIHVGLNTALKIDGSGTYYQYNVTQGAGIGGTTAEMNGSIEFAMTGSAFIKGTRQGAVIGAGARASSTSDAPGPITFTSGTYNIITNSRGAAIGGSAGSTGGSTGTSVYLKPDATLSVNTDYSGAVVGGGGYDAGNDSSGGTMYVSGGSLRPYVDKNAASNVNTGWNGKVLTEGVNDAVITAKRVDATGANLVYFCPVAIPESDADTYSITVDGTPYYNGTLHNYSFRFDGVDRSIDSTDVTPISTIANWLPETDQNVYLYLTGQDHTVVINGVPVTYVWDAETETFTAQELAKAAPDLTAGEDVQVGQDAVITFTADVEWQAAITGITVNGEAVEGYTVEDGVIKIPASAFAVAGDYDIVISANGYEDATVVQPIYSVGSQVNFAIVPADIEIIVSKGQVYTYTEDVLYGTVTNGTDDASATAKYFLEPGNYTATITKDGYYASEFIFKVADDGSVTSDAANVKNNYLNATTNTFEVELTPFVLSSNAGAWDGKTLDVSWYTESGTEFSISTPAQLMGMAAIVNGIYNAEITTIIDDANGDGQAETYAPVEYAALENRKIRSANSTGNSSGPNGNNQVTTNTYWYGIQSNGKNSDFNGKTVKLTADLDMGGYEQDGSWTGARYMSIGGQSPMHFIDYGRNYSDGYSILGSSFNGTLDGQGNIVKNIYANRYATGSNFGDSQSVGLIGRLGNHDSDPADIAALNPTVKNVAVTGYIYGRRSIGGIVGKIGQTTATRAGDGSIGGQILNCVNFAEVRNTDAKGVGGIAGAGWNKGLIQNCVNFGSIYAGRQNAGGISGSCEVKVVNCYTVGYVDAIRYNQAQAVGTNNGGAVFTNTYYLYGSALSYSQDGYANTAVYGSTSGSTLHEVAAFADLSGEEFLANLNGNTRDFAKASSFDAIYSILQGTTFTNIKLDASGVTAETMPIPRVFTTDTATLTSIEKTADPTTLEYISGQPFDTTGLEIWANYSDGTKEQLTDYDIIPDGGLSVDDQMVAVSGAKAGQAYRYSFPITVTQNEVTELRVTKNPTNTVYAQGEAFDPTGMIVSARYTNYPTTNVALTEEEYTTEMIGSQLVISHTYNGKTVTATVNLTVLDSPAPQQNEEGAYLIGNADELTWFENQVENLKNTEIDGIVYADFTASDSFDGIGQYSPYYSGTFDGGQHTITVSIANSSSAGFFNIVNGAAIQNLRIAGMVSTTSTSAGAGSIVGNASGSLTIRNCTADATVSGPAYVGGVFGKAMSMTTDNGLVVENCTFTGEVNATTTGAAYAGGIVGYHGGLATIRSCINSGAVTANSGTAVGGIVGRAAGQSTAGTTVITTITECGNDGNVSGKALVGGIVGSLEGPYDIVDSCYNVGSVTAVNPVNRQGVGGIVGTLYGTVRNSYNQGIVTVSGTTITLTSQYFGLGGIAGTNYRDTSSIINSYNAGALVDETETDRGFVGSMLGYGIYKLAIDHVYQLESDDEIPAVGGFASGKSLTGSLTTISEDELIPLASELGKAYKDNEVSLYHMGYPILIWENEDQDRLDAPEFDVEDDTVILEDAITSIELPLQDGSEEWTEAVTSVTIIDPEGNEIVLSPEQYTVTKDALTLLPTEDDPIVTISEDVGEATYFIRIEAKDYNPTEGNIKFVEKPTQYRRIYGANRYETSIQAANELLTIYGTDTFDAVVIANGENYPDALSGAYLAKVKNAPLLLVNNKTSDSVLNYVKEHLVEGGSAYLLGGEGVVSAAFENGINEAGYHAVRLGGKNRYETNLKILEEAGVSETDGIDLLVSSGTGFADALSASAVGKPIMLVGKTLTDEQKAYLETVDISQIYLIGGTGAVNETVAADLATYGETTRINGMNRYETSANIAKTFFDPEKVKVTSITMAYGENFPDGLSSAPVALANKAPLLLTDNRSDHYTYVKDYVEGAPNAKTATVLGGQTLISHETVIDVMGRELEEFIVQ